MGLVKRVKDLEAAAGIDDGIPTIREVIKGCRMGDR